MMFSSGWPADNHESRWSTLPRSCDLYFYDKVFRIFLLDLSQRFSLSVSFWHKKVNSPAGKPSCDSSRDVLSCFHLKLLVSCSAITLTEDWSQGQCMPCCLVDTGDENCHGFGYPLIIFHLGLPLHLVLCDDCWQEKASINLVILLGFQSVMFS